MKSSVFRGSSSNGSQYIADYLVFSNLPEAKASLILALTTGTIGLLGATAMAGTIGGGGVGDFGLNLRLPTLNTPLMFATVVILIVYCYSLNSSN